VEDMPIRVGVENGIEGKTIAWVFNHPGCFSTGEDTQEALHELLPGVQDFNQWLTRHGLETYLVDPGQAVQIEETWDVYNIDEHYAISRAGYEVNAWFQDDWRSLTEQEVEIGIAMLAASRADLLESVNGASQETLHAKFSGERWSIMGILNHVGQAEWWYLDRLEVAIARDELPAEPGDLLLKVRDHLVAVLPKLAAVNVVLGKDGEFWSPRKLLRRAVWHERDHAFHIRKLLASIE
jgi:hypothetical protein